MFDRSALRRWTWAITTATLTVGMLVGCSDGPEENTSAGAGGGSSSSSASAGSTGSSASAGEGGGGGASSSSSSTGAGGASNVDSLDVSGTLTPGQGKTVPASAGVAVIWTVSSGSPDYNYVYGKGTSTGETFKLSLTAPPPEEALNNGNLGVGVVVLWPQGKLPAEGKAGEEVVNGVIGAAGNYAIIYKGPNAPDMPWVSDFPPGYSCGKGAPPVPGSSHESFTPVDCSEVSITVDDIEKIKFVNWT
jgi:hypothetical protein